MTSSCSRNQIENIIDSVENRRLDGAFSQDNTIVESVQAKRLSSLIPMAETMTIRSSDRSRAPHRSLGMVVSLTAATLVLEATKTVAVVVSSYTTLMYTIAA